MASNDPIDFDSMSLEKFKTWSMKALKIFLHVRNKSVDGTFDELAARAFVAYEEKLNVDVSKEMIERQNLSEYREKLRLATDGGIPDPFTLTTGWLDESAMSFWPSVGFIDLCDYMRLKTTAELSNRLINEYKEGKAYRYFSSGWVKQVLYHNVSDDSDVCIMATKVTPSMRLRSPPHEVWAVIKKNSVIANGGEIISAYCTCTAGLQGCCNHIVGMLFRIEAAVSRGLTKLSKTSLPCEWNVRENFDPSKPIQVSTVKWKKSHYFESTDDSFHDSLLERSLNYSCMTEEQDAFVQENMLSNLGNELKDLVPNSCFIQMFDGKPPPKEPDIECPKSLFEIATDLAVSGEDDINVLLSEIKLDDKQISDISEKTKAQSNSKEWSLQRRGRITASLFHRVASKVHNLERNPNVDAVVKEIAGVQQTPQTEAMKHGKDTEPKAKLAYIRFMKRRHRTFVASDTGLIISHDYPFIGASPDLLVSCKCHGKGLCEIKCPYKKKNERPNHENYSDHLELVDGVTRLRKKSSHYTQVQGQMGVTGLKYCDVFVYKHKGHFVERVEFDSAFWCDLLQKLKFFWINHVGPSLLQGQFNLRIAVPENVSAAIDHPYDSKTDDHLTESESQSVIDEARAQSALSKPKYVVYPDCAVCLLSITNEYMQCGTCDTCYHENCLISNDNNCKVCSQ